LSARDDSFVYKQGDACAPDSAGDDQGAVAL